MDIPKYITNNQYESKYLFGCIKLNETSIQHQLPWSIYKFTTNHTKVLYLYQPPIVQCAFLIYWAAPGLALPSRWSWVLQLPLLYSLVKASEIGVAPHPVTILDVLSERFGYFLYVCHDIEYKCSNQYCYRTTPPQVWQEVRTVWLFFNIAFIVL